MVILKQPLLDAFELVPPVCCTHSSLHFLGNSLTQYALLNPNKASGMSDQGYCLLALSDARW